MHYISTIMISAKPTVLTEKDLNCKFRNYSLISYILLLFFKSITSIKFDIAVLT